jgi:hypothetical protein
VFCKHRNDAEYCHNICKKDCPSVSNLWYKFIRNPISRLLNIIFGEKLIYKIKYNIIYKIKTNMYNEKMKKKYPDYVDNEYNCGSYKFIWGVVSWDDLSGKEANFYTMNDIDISYNRETRKYYLSIETAYMFRNKESECKYLRKLLDAFTKYMNDNNLAKKYDFILFMSNPCITTECESIEELYANFKVFVEGYCKFYEFE